MIAPLDRDEGADDEIALCGRARGQPATTVAVMDGALVALLQMTRDALEVAVEPGAAGVARLAPNGYFPR